MSSTSRLKPAVDAADGLGEVGQRVRVGPDVVPLVRLGATTHDDEVSLGRKGVHLRTVALDVLHVVEADRMEDRLRLAVRQVRQHRDLGEQQRPLQRRQPNDRTLDLRCNVELDRLLPRDRIGVGATGAFTHVRRG